MGRCISVWNRVSFLIEKSRKMSIPTFPIITRKKRIFAPRRKIWWKVFWKKVFFQQSFEKKLFWKIFFSKNLSKKSFSPKTFLDQDGFLVFSRFLLLKIDFKKIQFLYATKVSNLFCIQKISELPFQIAKILWQKNFFPQISHISEFYFFILRDSTDYPSPFMSRERPVQAPSSRLFWATGRIFFKEFL